MLDVKRNLTTMTDFYELTMSAGYLDEGYVDKVAVFDMFFRRVPDGGGYAVMAGLQQFIDAVDHLKFTDEDITYLRSTKTFDEKFLNYLPTSSCTATSGPLRRHADLPAGADCHGRGPCHRVPAAGNAAARHLQPSVPDRHQGQPHRPLRCRPPGHGVRRTPRARV